MTAFANRHATFLPRSFARITAAISVGALSVLAVPAAAQADQMAVGKRQFIRCQACHALTANAPKKVGPSLYGMMNKKAGTIDANFKYSAAMKKSDAVWDDATLDKWLTKPSQVVPGTTMVFAGMPKPADRAALIAFLKAETKAK